MKKTIKPPTFANEDEEGIWWASREGREFLVVATACFAGEDRAGEGARATLKFFALGV